MACMYKEWEDMIVMVDLDKREFIVSLKLGNGEWLDKEYKNHQNDRILSANLACVLTLGRAIELLEENEVPKGTPLWFLNHYNG